MLLALAIAVVWGRTGDAHQPGVSGMLAGAAITGGAAVVLQLLGRGADLTVRVRDALMVVTIGWVAACVFGAIPYVWSGAIPNLADAYFESVSGFTTTGATILTDIEALPDPLHMWRVTTHWLGGLGIVVLFVALFPQLGIGAKHLFKSEVPGPITEGLRPKIKQTAVSLWWIYLALTLTEALLLWGVGLTFFDAIAHSFSTLATGGFSTRNASVAAFDSPAVEWIICLFMYLAGVNFALHYAALSGRLRTLTRNGEWRWYTGMVLGLTLLIAVLIAPLHGAEIETSLRKGCFQVLATLTGTGLNTDDFELWPPLCQVLIVFMMFVGGSAGSTTGGMKVSRVVIMLKAALIEVAHTAKPSAVQVVKLGRTAIRSDVLKQVFAYAVIFVSTVLLCTLWLAATDVDLLTSFTAALSCVANVGPGLGEVGPTDHFAMFSDHAKLVLTFAMVLGRLEFFTVLALLVPSGWR